jgi:hypothetical protein
MEQIPTQESIFKSAWAQLSKEEQEIITYIHFHYSGEGKEKLPGQDELERSAKEKLSIAGVAIENLGQYLERE